MYLPLHFSPFIENARYILVTIIHLGYFSEIMLGNHSVKLTLPACYVYYVFGLVISPGFFFFGLKLKHFHIPKSLACLAMVWGWYWVFDFCSFIYFPWKGRLWYWVFDFCPFIYFPWKGRLSDGCFFIFNFYFFNVKTILIEFIS